MYKVTAVVLHLQEKKKPNVHANVVVPTHLNPTLSVSSWLYFVSSFFLALANSNM